MPLCERGAPIDQAPRALTPSCWHAPRKMGVAEVYEHLVRARWHTPTSFTNGHDGAKRWNSRSRPPEAWEDDLRAVYAGLRHPAVPRYISDRAYKAATGTELVGPRYFKDSLRGQCKRCSKPESAEHKYCQCAEVSRLWKLVLSTWRRMSGERLDPADEWRSIAVVAKYSIA